MAVNNEHGTITSQEYTGLKDKNGREIYEGDICKNPGKMARRKKVIRWLGERSTGIGWNTTPEFAACTEVIGNIYETPEVLEENQ